MTLLIYVDDFLITGNSEQFIHETKEVLTRSSRSKDLKHFLGIEVLRYKRGVLLN